MQGTRVDIKRIYSIALALENLDRLFLLFAALHYDSQEGVGWLPQHRRPQSNISSHQELSSFPYIH
jgi:hypothetical protein